MLHFYGKNAEIYTFYIIIHFCIRIVYFKKRIFICLYYKTIYLI